MSVSQIAVILFSTDSTLCGLLNWPVERKGTFEREGDPGARLKLDFGGAENGYDWAYRTACRIGRCHCAGACTRGRLPRAFEFRVESALLFPIFITIHVELLFVQHQTHQFKTYVGLTVQMTAFTIQHQSYVCLCSTRDHNMIGDENRGIHNPRDQVACVIVIGIHYVGDAN